MNLGWASPLSDTFSFSALTQLAGRQEGHLACKSLGIGLLVVMVWLQLCMSYSSSCRRHLHHLRTVTNYALWSITMPPMAVIIATNRNRPFQNSLVVTAVERLMAWMLLPVVDGVVVLMWSKLSGLLTPLVIKLRCLRCTWNTHNSWCLTSVYSIKWQIWLESHTFQLNGQFFSRWTLNSLSPFIPELHILFGQT